MTNLTQLMLNIFLTYNINCFRVSVPFNISMYWVEFKSGQQTVYYFEQILLVKVYQYLNSYTRKYVRPFNLKIRIMILISFYNKQLNLLNSSWNKIITFVKNKFLPKSDDNEANTFDLMMIVDHYRYTA